MYYLFVPYCGSRKLLHHCCSSLPMNCLEGPEVPIQRKMVGTPGLTSYSCGQLSHRLHLADCEPALWITELGDVSLSSFQNQWISLPGFPFSSFLFLAHLPPLFSSEAQPPHSLALIIRLLCTCSHISLSFSAIPPQGDVCSHEVY